jgi:hypothetical protein
VSLARAVSDCGAWSAAPESRLAPLPHVECCNSAAHDPLISCSQLGMRDCWSHELACTAKDVAARREERASPSSSRGGMITVGGSDCSVSSPSSSAKAPRGGNGGGVGAPCEGARCDDAEGAFWDSAETTACGAR